MSLRKRKKIDPYYKDKRATKYTCRDKNCSAHELKYTGINDLEGLANTIVRGCTREESKAGVCVFHKEGYTPKNKW